MAGRFAAAERLGRALPLPPKTTAMGSLLNHITGGANVETFQPMNINFGLFPPLDGHFKGKEGGKEKRRQISARALRDVADYAARKPGA